MYITYKIAIAAYNNHFGEVEDMEMEWYKEAGDQKPVVVHVVVVVCVHHSMDHAIQGMQVGHTHGLPVAADGPEGVGKRQLMLVEFGMEVADDVVDHMGEGDEHEHRQELVAAQIADNKVFEDENLFV